MTKEEWAARGYQDGFDGIEPSPPQDDAEWSAYMHGYKSGKRKAGW